MLEEKEKFILKKRNIITVVMIGLNLVMIIEEEIKNNLCIRKLINVFYFKIFVFDLYIMYLISELIEFLNIFVIFY